MQILIIFLFCPGAGETALSSQETMKYTARELIEKIIESENNIKDVQAEYLFFEPDINLPILYAHWSYQPDRELVAGLKFRQAGSNLRYMISTKHHFCLDEKQHFYNYRNEIQKGIEQLLIRPAKLFDMDAFRVYMTPNSLLGFDISCGTRRSFGRSLQQAPKVSLRERTEKIDGHNCYLLEAAGIKNPEFSYDVRAWIDTERDLRPLRIDIFYNTMFGGRKYQPFERLSRRIYYIRLRKIDGIWFPIEGKRDNFTYEDVLPPELEGLTKEQARQKFSERELKEIAQKIEEVAVLSVPTRKTLLDVDSIRLNQGIEPEKFVIKPPIGCKVYDEVEGRQYTVENDEETHLQSEVSFLKLKRFALPDLMKVIYPDTLIGCTLQDLNQLEIGLDSEQFEGKPLLLCIWDMQQRPSRAFIKKLAGRSKNLVHKGYVIVGIHTSKVNENKLKEWTTTNGISFQVIISETNEQHTQLSLAAKSLPWLILTDRRHIVTAEGFGIDDLNDKI